MGFQFLQGHPLHVLQLFRMHDKTRRGVGNTIFRRASPKKLALGLFQFLFSWGCILLARRRFEVVKKIAVGEHQTFGLFDIAQEVVNQVACCGWVFQSPWRGGDCGSRSGWWPVSYKVAPGLSGIGKYI